jgi:hypothetical protein
MYGRPPGYRRRWHKLSGGKTACRSGRGSGQAVTGKWELLDRLPPRHDKYCGRCFPGYVPAQDSPAVVGSWDLDAFIEDLKAG